MTSQILADDKMLGLLGLPNEILSNIIKTVRPDEIESFSQSCRLIHSLSKDVLKEHAANKKKYSKLTLSAVVASPKIKNPKAIHPVFMLRDILQNDRVAFYPVEVVIRVGDERWDQRKRLEAEVSRTFAQYDTEIFSLLSKSPYLRRFEVAQWHKRIGRGRIGAAVAFLLTILPNVQRITMTHHLLDDKYLTQMLDKLSRAVYNLSLDVRRLTALSKVSDVKVEGMDVYHVFHYSGLKDLCILGLFAALPSIRSINGRSVDGRTFRRQQCPDGILVPFSPSLREVRFTKSAICPHILRQLLRSIKTLQRFTYSYEYHTGGADFEPRHIVALLQTYAKPSLLKLDITRDHQTKGVSLSDQSVDSLRAFGVLERIRVNAHMFRTSSRDPQPLTTMLPASIQELELVGEIDENEAGAMFAGLFASKATSFPHLRKLVFQPLMPLSQTMRDEGKAVGISFKTVIRVGSVPSSRF